MSLYDGYRLSNSRSVKQYQGSPVPEMVQVSMELQKLYDTSQDRMDYATQYLNSITTPFAKDQAALQEVRNRYTDGLGKLSKRPDLENAVRETTMLANQLPQDYAPFAQSIKEFQQRKEELQKATEKNPTDAGYLTPASADALLARDMYQYRGVQKDPYTGKFKGGFQGQAYSKDIDMNKKVDDWFQGAKPVVNGRKVEYLNGQWIDSDSRKTVTMPAERIQQIINDGIANDAEAKSWIQQQQNLGTYDLDASKVPADLKLSAAMKERLAKGEDLTTILREGKAGKIANDIIYKAHAYGVHKYAQRDIETEHGKQGNPFEVAKANKVELEATPRFLIPGNDTVLEDKDKDLGALTTTISGLEASVQQMEGDLKLADPAGKVRIQGSIDAAKDILTAKQELLTNTKNAIAQRISGGQYKTAEEYYTKTTRAKVLAALPATISGTADGKTFTIDKTELHNAIKNGKVERKSGVSVGTGYGTNTSDSYYVTLSNGRKVKVDNKDFDKVANGQQMLTTSTDNFNNAVKKELETNAQSYAFKPLSMNLSETEQKGLNDLLKAEPNSVAWTKPGSTERVSDDDLPASMNIGSMKVIAKNGSFYLNSSGLDEKGKPTGNTYTAKITPGSNVGRKVAANLIKEAKGIRNLDSDMLLTVGVLSGQYRYTGDITSLQNYEPLHIKDKSGATFLRAQRIKGTTDSDQTPIFGLVDEKGNVVSDAQGNFYQTSDPTTVDYWIQHALQADMLKK